MSLLKSPTRGFKIGRTNSVPRRWTEIAAAGPEAVELVHYFGTIDHVGIQAYWLIRFAARRKRRGEWFELSPADVSEFVRRSKSM